MNDGNDTKSTEFKMGLIKMPRKEVIWLQNPENLTNEHNRI